MIIFGYCIMPSHIHLLFYYFVQPKENLQHIFGGFKDFTSRKLIEAMQENGQESRREWLLLMMRRAGERNSNVKNYQLWQQNNKLIGLWSLKVFQQKLNYLHQNPVESGFVVEPWEWKYSSARNYFDGLEAFFINRCQSIVVGHERDARASGEQHAVCPIPAPLPKCG